MIVIDASVAIKWFVVEDGREDALAILELIKNAPADFAVPEFFYIEMMSVMTRLVSDQNVLDSIVDDLYNLGFMQLRVGAKLLKVASQISRATGISGYDALYAACAKSVKGKWLTADRKAHRKVAELKVSSILGTIEKPFSTRLVLGRSS